MLEAAISDEASPSLELEVKNHIASDARVLLCGVGITAVLSGDPEK